MIAWTVFGIACFVHSLVPEFVLGKTSPTPVSFASAEQLQQPASQILVCGEADGCCCTCRLLKRVGAVCILKEKKKNGNFSLLWKMGIKVWLFPLL